MQVEKHMMCLAHRVRVGVGIGTTPLKVLPAHQTRINIDPCQRDGAQLLEIEVQQVAVDGVQIGTHPVLWIEHGWRVYRWGIIKTIFTFKKHLSPILTILLHGVCRLLLQLHALGC